MNKKIITLIIVFFSFFFFSCFNVNASEWLEYDTTYFNINAYPHLSYSNSSWNSGSSWLAFPRSSYVFDTTNNSNYQFHGIWSVGTLNRISFGGSVPNKVFEANHEHIISIQIGSGNTLYSEEDNTYFSILPYLYTVGRNFTLDTNLIFSSKEFNFNYSDGEGQHTIHREDLIDSTFSMSYDDAEDEIRYYITFTFVPPVDISSFNVVLTPDITLQNTSSQKIWKASSDNIHFASSEFNITRFLYDHDDFTGYEHPDICIGDQCTYSPYLGYSHQIQTQIQDGGFNLITFISDSFSKIGSFISGSFYIFGMITSLFTALPIEVRSLFVFTFTLGCVIILWKIIRA